MAAMDMADAVHRERDEHDERVRFFNNFLHSKREHYEKLIKKELANQRTRITVQLKDIEAAQAGQSRELLQNPVKYIPAWEEALLSFVRDIDEKFARQLTKPVKLDIQGAFGRNHVTPRGLTASTLGQLMCVEGLVVKAGTMAPKLLQSIHVERKDFGSKEPPRVESRDHRDAAALVTSTGSGAMPKADVEGRPLEYAIGLSVFKDFQKFNLQETPENAPPGQIPLSCEVICEGDLADKAKPGERVRVIGVYRSFPGQLSDHTDGKFPARLIALSIENMKEIIQPMMTTPDIAAIRELAARPEAFEILARSFAPSICGHETVKKGLLLQMIGGVEKNLANGTHLRGDINVLLVGDPSCGKSQMLRFVMNVAPLAISTTGRGSSGVGLTAAITKDVGSREFSIEAGAMVLADRGFICIDEFDKMGLDDRVAIHEAMEQQCITISKAGIHTTLNARCSVVAAANPIHGTFDDSLDLAANIGLPDSLLSRFDLVYVVRDISDEEIDRRISSQVLRQARLRVGNTIRGVMEVHSSILERKEDASRQNETTEVFEKQYGEGDDVPKVVTVDFLRKYLRMCKRKEPMLSQEARIALADRYTDMRMRFQAGFMDQAPGAPGQAGGQKQKHKLAVTTRTLEGLIRLATAHAKLKLQDEVTPEDVEEAYKLMLAAREEKPAPRAEGHRALDDEDADEPPPSAKRRRTEATSEQRLDGLQQLVARVFARRPDISIRQDELLAAVNEARETGEEAFSEAELEQLLARLEERGKVMRASGTVYPL